MSCYTNYTTRSTGKDIAPDKQFSTTISFYGLLLPTNAHITVVYISPHLAAAVSAGRHPQGAGDQPKHVAANKVKYTLL